MTNFFKDLFNDDSIIGLCAFESSQERCLKRLKRNVSKLDDNFTTIIFKRNMNKFISQTFKSIDQIPYRV